jgi:AcrR family transcriptional regulator
MTARRTRQRILDAAQRLIEKGGFTQLTTKAIAEEAGCAEGTIFTHFKRKDDLCLAVVLENSPKFKEAVARKRAGHGSVRQNLEEIALAAIGFSEKLIPLAASLLADASLLARHRKVLRERGRGPKDSVDLIAAYIAEEQTLGRIGPSTAPAVVSAIMLGSCFHWVFLRQAMGTSVLPMEDREFAAGLVDTIIRGVSPIARD